MSRGEVNKIRSVRGGQRKACRGGEGGEEKKVWIAEIVIYSSFGPGAFLTNYTQASKLRCKYIRIQLNISLFTGWSFQKALKLQRSMKKNVTLSPMFRCSVARTTEPWLSCPGC